VIDGADGQALDALSLSLSLERPNHRRNIDTTTPPAHHPAAHRSR
jgi:hypothetical protein